jgi:hypothetical protein
MGMLFETSVDRVAGATMAGNPNEGVGCRSFLLLSGQHVGGVPTDVRLCSA